MDSNSTHTYINSRRNINSSFNGNRSFVDPRRKQRIVVFIADSRRLHHFRRFHRFRRHCRFRRFGRTGGHFGHFRLDFQSFPVKLANLTMTSFSFLPRAKKLSTKFRRPCLEPVTKFCCSDQHLPLCRPKT